MRRRWTDRSGHGGEGRARHLGARILKCHKKEERNKGKREKREENRKIREKGEIDVIKARYNICFTFP